MSDSVTSLIPLAHISEDRTRQQTILEHLQGTAELATKDLQSHLADRPKPD